MSNPTLDDLLRGDERAADPRFRELVASVLELAPRNARADAIMRLSNHLWSMFSDALAIKMAERLRITEIATSTDALTDVPSALKLALATDHPAKVAIAMLERQRAANLS